MSPERVAITMRTLRASGWISAAEMAKHLRPIDPQTCRTWLDTLADHGICRRRLRQKEELPNGNFPPGQHPREYRLHTDFGGLA